MQRAPLLGGIVRRVLEEQRVVEAESGRQHQRDQVEQVQRHAADVQDTRRTSSVVSAMGVSTRRTRDGVPQRDDDHEHQQHRRDGEAPQDTLALMRDEILGRLLQVQQRHALRSRRQLRATLRGPARPSA